MNDVLLHSIFEFILVLAALHVTVCHDTHDLLVIIQNGQAWQLRLFIQESGVGIAVILVLRVGLSHSGRPFLILVHHRLRARTLLIWLQTMEVILGFVGEGCSLLNGEFHSKFIDCLTIVIVECS